LLKRLSDVALFDVEDLGAGSVKVKWQTRDAKRQARFHVWLVCAPLKLSTNHETATM
jgi:hypothetical protein